MNFRKFFSSFWRLVKPDATDENWKFYGEKSPYFGVVSWSQFRQENLNEQSIADFFATGEAYVETLTGIIRATVAPDFRPLNAVDFGCGVGRLVIPLAKRCDKVTGIDVSPAMIEEAKRNCRKKNIENASFVSSLEDLSARNGQFDFVNSFIVFQHIRPERGYDFFRQLIGLLQTGGIGAVQLTYCDPGGKRARLMQWVYRKFPLLYAAKNAREGRAFAEPMMDMAEYSLNRIFRILQENGCGVCHVRFSRHGILGVLLVFKKERLPEL